MLRAIMTKKRVAISLLAMLMVMTYVMPSAFHLSHCHDTDEHLQTTAAPHSHIALFAERHAQEALAPTLNHCCAHLTICTSEISHRTAPLRSKQTIVSAPIAVHSNQSVATFPVSDHKTRTHLFHQTEITSANIAILRTIILQV